MAATRKRRLPKSERRQAAALRHRAWAHHVAVQVEVRKARLAVIALRSDLRPHEGELVGRAERLLDDAREAAYRDPPFLTRGSTWWRGTLVESSYQNLHGAESIIALLLDRHEVVAEVPDVVAKLESTLPRADPRRAGVQELTAMVAARELDLDLARERLRKAIDLGNSAADQQHSRLRSFRNLVLTATGALTFFMVLFVVLVAQRPRWVPLCFDKGAVCPAGPGASGAEDVIAVALFGMLGGVLAAVVSISRLQGSAAPYNVATVLALLKIPFGAMTAIIALVLIRGGFVPGLSNLDTQAQILGYALLFGYGQQLLTQVIDKQGQSLISALPSKTSPARPPSPAGPPPQPDPALPTQRVGAAAGQPH